MNLPITAPILDSRASKSLGLEARPGDPTSSQRLASGAAPATRLVFTQGEDEPVLRAGHALAGDRQAWPIFVGRGAAMRHSIARLGLGLLPGVNCDVVDLHDAATCRRLADEYLSYNTHMPVSYARAAVANKAALAGALLVSSGRADALLAAAWEHGDDDLEIIARIVGQRRNARAMAVMPMLSLADRVVFIADTQVNAQPSAQQIAEIVRLCAAQVRQLGLEPRVALLSHSNFGSVDLPSAHKMRQALRIVQTQEPSLPIGGEMRADAALSAHALDPDQPGQVNVLVMPSLDAASISFHLLRMTSAKGAVVGGFLLGANAPVHILAPSPSVQDVLVMTQWALRAATGAPAPTPHPTSQ